MKAIVQRVTESSVSINGNIHSEIKSGLCILIGYCKDDQQSVNTWLKDKLLGLRVFSDESGKMNKSIQDIEGSLMIIPNFTLCADMQRGLRPSFTTSESPDKAEQLFNELIYILSCHYPHVQTGIFGADMQVLIKNDGPVTLIFEHS